MATQAPIPTPTPVATLSLDDYLSQLDCESFGDGPEPETYGDFSVVIARVIDRMSALVPPAEIAEWHDTSLTSFEKLKAAIDPFPADNEIEFITLLAIAEVTEEEDAKIREILGRLPEDVRLRLIDAECADEAAAAGDDHGNDTQNATVIAVSENVQGSLDSGSDKDAFVIQAQAGREYTVALPYRVLFSLGTKTGPLITVYDSFGQEVARSEDDSETEVTWRAEVAGSYYVVLGDGASQGDYTLAVNPAIPAPEAPVSVATVAPVPGSNDDHANSIDNATPVTVGEAVEGGVNYIGDTDFFVLQVEEGVSYQIDVELDTLEDSWLRLLDSTFWELAYNDDHGDSLASGILWTAPGSGDYYVEVGGYGVGSYALTVTATDIVDDHGDSIAGATAVTVGESTEGAVDYDGDADFFVFQAEEGVLYHVDVELGTLNDSWLALLDADEWELAYNDDNADSLASRIVWAPPGSGEYYLQVGGYGVGSYALTVAVSDIVDDHANSIADATTAAVGEAVVGVLDYEGDADLFVFEAEEGVTYQVDVELGTLDDSWLALFDSDEWELAYNDDRTDSLASRIEWTAPSSAEYYAEVGGFGTGSYTVTITVDEHGSSEDGRGEAQEDDHADYQYEATAILVGETVEGSISNVDDFDWFSFQAEAGKHYTIAITLGTLDASWNFLDDSDGETLATTYDESPFVRWLAPNSGTYYVGTQGLGGTGTYTVTVSEDSHGDDPENATAITVGESIEGALDYEGDGDVFAFQAEAGQTYEFDLVPGTLNAYDLSVWSSDSGWTKLDQPSWAAQRSGEHYLAVWSSDGNTGTYTLTIAQP